MLTHIDFQIESLFLLALALVAVHLLSRVQDNAARIKTVSAADYLYKIARLTGASEYDIFHKSAENWPVSKSMVEKHFKDYLRHQVTPCYVNAFVRKHQHQIDQLQLPPY